MKHSNLNCWPSSSAHETWWCDCWVFFLMHQLLMRWKKQSAKQNHGIYTVLSLVTGLFVTIQLPWAEKVMVYFGMKGWLKYTRSCKKRGTLFFLTLLAGFRSTLSMKFGWLYFCEKWKSQQNSCPFTNPW